MLRVKLIYNNLIINKQPCRKKKPSCQIFKYGLLANSSTVTLSLSNAGGKNCGQSQYVCKQDDQHLHRGSRVYKVPT